MSRIFLCGSRSVGKTTLCKDWCERNKEYVHIDGNDVTSKVMSENDISRDDIINSMSTEDKKLYFNLQKSLFIEQNKRETLLKDRLFISDSGPDPLVYTYRESKEMSYELFEHEDVKNCFNLYRKSLVVVVAPIEDDREQDSYTNALKQVLKECDVTYMYLREKDRSKRLHLLRLAALKGCVPIPLEQFKEQHCLAYYMDIEKMDMFCSTILPRQDNATSIRKFLINPNEIQLSCQSMNSTNRMLERYGVSNFILIEFHWKVSDADIRDILSIGLYVDGDEYQFLACSSGGLMSRTCYLMKGDTDYIDTVLRECGDFSVFNRVTERFKKISLLFSDGINTGVSISNDEFEVIEDISNEGEVFTDSCGLIGLNLAKKLAIGSNVVINSPDDNIPTVFQITFQGYKGVVMKTPNINQDSLQLRNSMFKFSAGTKPFPEIWVCNYSRPNSYGNLNKQFIMLLSGLGISDEIFLTKQDSYFNALDNMLIDPKFAIKLLNWKNYPELADSVAACPSSEERQQNQEIQSKLKFLKNNLVGRIEKLEIPIINSRYLFGVCDPIKLLEYGECFVRYTCNDKLKTLQAGTYVIVGKNPCYNLGDIRVLIAVDYPDLYHLVDCIVFPVKGDRPHTSEIAGSCLGVDQYFVCWDDTLIPNDVSEPYKYPDTDPDQSQNLSRDMIIDFFAGCMNSMDMINSYYQYWADRLGAGCRACRDLGQLLSRGVDSAKTRDMVPYNLKPPRNETNLTSHGEMVWVKMEKIAQYRRNKFTQNIIEDALINTNAISSIPEDFIIRILRDRNRSICEYKMLILLHKWCSIQKLTDVEISDKFIELSDFINFGIITLNERIEAIRHGIPITHVMNALYKSKILTTNMVQSLILDIPCYGWKYCFREKSIDFDWSHLSSAITRYTESFIILQLEEYILAFHIIGTIQLGESVLPPGGLTSYLFSGGQMFRYVTECEYNINLATEVIQFYIRDKENTFLFLKRQGRSSKNDFEGVKYDIISIELDKFKTKKSGNYKRPLIRKKNFQMIEVFVKNECQQEISCYLDSNSHQTEGLYSTNDIVDQLEDLPSEYEDCFDELRTLPDTPILAMKKFASRGDSVGFSGILQYINSSSIDSVILIEQFIILLSNVVVKISHKCCSELQALELDCNSPDEYIEQECPKSPTPPILVEESINHQSNNETNPANIFQIASTADELVIQTTLDSYAATNPFFHEVEQYTHDKKYSSSSSVRTPPIEEIGSDLDAQPVCANKISTETFIPDVEPDVQVSTWDKFRDSLIAPEATTQAICTDIQLPGPVVQEIQSETSDTEITPENPFIQVDQPEIQSICNGLQLSEPVVQEIKPKILIETSNTEITLENPFVQADQPEIQSICNGIQLSESVVQEIKPEILIETSNTEITLENPFVEADQPEIQSICNGIQLSESVVQEIKQEILTETSNTEITLENQFVQADQPEIQSICNGIQLSESVVQEIKQEILTETSNTKISPDNPFVEADQPEIQATIQSTTLVEVTELRNSLINTVKSLEKILNSPRIEITQARDILLLYSSLSKLHLYDVIKQHLCKSINKIEIATISQYFDCVSDWELWTFLPLSVSSQLSNQLFTLSLNLVHTPDRDPENIDAPSIQDLCMSNTVPHFDQNKLNYYRCYFSHLILNYLLYESNAGELIEDSDNTLCMLKVSHCQEEEHQDNNTIDTTANPGKYWKAIFSPTSKIVPDKFALGSYVKISYMARSISSHSREPIALGYISKVSNILVSITVEILEPVPDCIKRSAGLEIGLWTLTLLDNVTTFKKSSKALHSLHENKIISILTHPNAFPPPLGIAQEHNLDYSAKPSLPVEEIEYFPNPYDVYPDCMGCNNRISFSKKQENAIFSALRRSLTLIEGLPGTGKTVVAAEIVHQLCHLVKLNDNKDDAVKILVTAATNNAVDNITYKLLDLGMLVLRVGDVPVAKDLREHSLEYQLEIKRIELQESKNGEFKVQEQINKILKSADIIATTCSGAGDNILDSINFRYILIDEATQVLEPVSLIPIIKSCEKLILIGDSNQLIPMLADEAETALPLNALRITLFHRLHAKMEALLLDEQYRMHPAIAEFPSRIFYSGRLRTAVTSRDRTPPDVRFLTKDRPVTFCNVESGEEEAAGSWKNPGEASKVVEIVKELIATREYKISNIGIITPYVGQVECIKDALEGIQVDVDTIDNFKGREKEIIVFCTVRNTEHGDISLIEDPNIINVLLTRAKRAVIGVGNPITLSRCYIWNEWYSFYFTDEGDNEDNATSAPSDDVTEDNATPAPPGDVTEAEDWAWDT